VSLIFANLGLGAGILSNELFSAILLMVVASTLITPPLLTWAFGRWGATMSAAAP
jgi:Kef-type K+ transport system membrane component KefB